MKVRALLAKNDHLPRTNGPQLDKYRETQIETFAEATEKVRVLFKCRVKTVAWKDGVASLFVTAPLANTPGRPTPAFVFKQPQALEVEMTKADAASVRKGGVVIVDALLTVRPWKTLHFSHREKAQVLFVAADSRIPRGGLGTAVSRDLTVTIDKTEFPSRWHDPEPQPEESEEEEGRK